MIKYRSDIDGLRALAVLMVVIYHFKSDAGFNGYMGVDIFFVISGFLITKIIHKEINEGTFSLQNFYERRVKRIFPALITVLFTTTCVAYFLFLPSELLAYAKSSLASIFFSSNILFYSEAGYFDADASLKPLLHTWSLAVEEQFYIFFPLILMGLHKWAGGHLKKVVILLFILSLALNGYFMFKNYQSAAFYLLPIRAWELLAGGLLALGAFPSLKLNRLGANVLTFSGFVLIILGIGLDIDKQFYGAYLFPVILGTALIIYTGTINRDSFVYKGLSVKPMLFFGRISYSLYLWHWPIYVFGQYYTIDSLYKPSKAALILFSIILSYLSWRFIEQPMRQKSVKIFASKFMRVGFVGLIGIIILCGVIIHSDGRSIFLSDRVLRITQVKLGIDFTETEIFDGIRGAVFGYSDDIQDTSVLLVGDSHAKAVTPAIYKQAIKNKQTVLFLRNNCLVPDGFIEHDGKLKNCSKKMQLIIDYVHNNSKVKTIIIAQRWSKRTDKWPTEYAVNEDDYLDLRKRTFVALVESLSSNHVEVLIVAQPPEFHHNSQNIPSIYARLLIRGRDAVAILSPTLEDYLEDQEKIWPILKHVEKHTVAKVIWLHKELCQNIKQCTFVDGDNIYYYDDNHLSKYGAEHVSHLFDF